MTNPFDPSLISGPVAIPIFGPEETDLEHGHTFRPVTGWRPGYRVNIARSIVTEAMEPFEVTPDPEWPVRVFAGDEYDPETGRWGVTAFLKFEDEDEALTILADHVTEAPDAD